MSTIFYVGFSDMELVGHAYAIPDASELSLVLAARIRLLVEERDGLQRALTKSQQQVMALELGVALDKIAAYQDINE